MSLRILLLPVNMTKVPGLYPPAVGHPSRGHLCQVLAHAKLDGSLCYVTLVLIPVTYLLSASGKVQVNAEALQLFAPLPAVMSSPDNPVTDAKVTLGRILYYDPRLSANQKISCNTCHPLDAYGAESKSVSTGFKNQQGKRNAPTVYNAAGHFVQFWDGRAPTVEEQAKGPITNPVEMAMPSNAAAVEVIKSMPDYVALFQTAFPQDKDPITYNNMALAIGAFERGLVTPSAWDAFIQGDQSALTDAQKSGFNTFAATGCQWCHSGPYVGGSAYQKLGVVKPWPNQTDQGVYQLTKDDMDKMVFKVPSLRTRVALGAVIIVVVAIVISKRRAAHMGEAAPIGAEAAGAVSPPVEGAPRGRGHPRVGRVGRHGDLSGRRPRGRRQTPRVAHG